MIPPMKLLAEGIRIRYLYRRMILNGEIKISHGTAKRMVGPDCAYHLYGRHTPAGKGKGTRERDKGKQISS